MPAQGRGHQTPRAEAVPLLACKTESSRSSSSHPSLDFVGRMKTFHTSIDIPGCTSMVCLALLWPQSLAAGSGNTQGNVLELCCRNIPEGIQQDCFAFL